MQRNWTKIAEAEGFDRQRIERAIANLTWQALPLEASMMAGMGIKAAIKELRIPKVSHVADSRELAPFGFYGIRGHYQNGQAEVYIVDRGSDLIPVCSDFHAKENCNG